MIASLTKAAALEAAGRTELSPRAVGTLHSHAYQRLDTPVIAEKGKPLKAFNEWVPIGSYRLSAGTGSLDSSVEMANYTTDGDRLMAEASTLRARMVAQELWPREVRHFHGLWCEFKQDSGTLDFTDLIEQALERVDLQGCSVLMVDEAQDMSRLEMALAHKWGEQSGQFVMVGDPDQAIFSFRGADPEVFYAQQAKSEHVLSQSYRVPKAVHARAVEWIERVEGRVPVEYKPTDIEGRCDVNYGLCFKDPSPIVSKAMELPGTVMILASCGYMLNPIISELRRRAIPFHNPYRPAHGGWNPLGGARRLLAYLRPHGEVWGDEARVWTWKDVYAWVEVLQAKGVLTPGAKTFLKSKATTLGRLEEEEIACDLETLYRQMEGESMMAASSGDIEWWAKHLLHDAAKRQRFCLDVARKHGARMLRETPKIIVSTIHGTKGGEADNVIISPDLSRAAYWEQWMPRDQRASTQRLYYVGMTRARHRLILCGTSTSEAVEW